MSLFQFVKISSFQNSDDKQRVQEMILPDWETDTIRLRR